MKKLFNSKIHILTVLFISMVILLSSACKNQFSENQTGSGKILPVLENAGYSRTIFPEVDKEQLTDFVLYKTSVNDANKIGSWADSAAFAEAEAIEIDTGTYDFILTAKLGVLSFKGIVSAVKIEYGVTTNPKFILSMDNLGDDETEGSLALTVNFSEDDFAAFDTDSLKINLVSLSDSTEKFEPETTLNEEELSLLITASLPAGEYLVSLEATKNNGSKYTSYSEVVAIASGLVSSKTYVVENFIDVINVSTFTNEDGSTVTTTTGKTETGSDFTKIEEKDKDGNLTKLTESEIKTDGSSIQTVTSKNDEGDAIVIVTTKDTDENITEKETVAKADGSKTETTTFPSKVTVKTELDADGKVTGAEAKDGDGKDIELTEYTLLSQHQYNAANYSYNNISLSSLIPDEEFITGDKITVTFTGITKNDLKDLHFGIVSTAEIDDYWNILTPWYVVFWNSKTGDRESFSYDFNIEKVAKTQNIDDIKLVIFSSYLDDETMDEGMHKDSVSIFANIKASLDKSNRVSKVNLTLEPSNGSANIQYSIYPGKKIGSTPILIENTFFDHCEDADGNTVEYAPEEDCTLKAVVSDTITSAEGRLSISLNPEINGIVVTIRHLNEKELYECGYWCTFDFWEDNSKIKKTMGWNGCADSTRTTPMEKSFVYPFVEAGKNYDFVLLSQSGVVDWHVEKISFTSPVTGISADDYINSDKLSEISQLKFLCSSDSYTLTINKDFRNFFKTENISSARLWMQPKSGDTWTGSYVAATIDKPFIEDGKNINDDIVEDFLNGCNLEEEYLTAYGLKTIATCPVWHTQGLIYFTPKNFTDTLYENSEFNLKTDVIPEHGKESASYLYGDERINSPVTVSIKSNVEGANIDDIELTYRDKIRFCDSGYYLPGNVWCSYPTVDGYVFAGVYTDSAYETKVSTNETWFYVTEDTTFYLRYLNIDSTNTSMTFTISGDDADKFKFYSSGYEVQSFPATIEPKYTKLLVEAFIDADEDGAYDYGEVSVGSWYYPEWGTSSTTDIQIVKTTANFTIPDDFAAYDTSKLYFVNNIRSSGSSSTVWGPVTGKTGSITFYGNKLGAYGYSTTVALYYDADGNGSFSYDDVISEEVQISSTECDSGSVDITFVPLSSK